MIYIQKKVWIHFYTLFSISSGVFFVKWKGVELFISMHYDTNYITCIRIQICNFGYTICKLLRLPLCHLGPPRHAFLLNSPLSANQQSRPLVETSRHHQKGGGRHHEQPYKWHPSYLFLPGYTYRNLSNSVVL